MGERSGSLEQIAASLETTTDLLPHLPHLLVDLHELGSHPRVITGLLHPLRHGAVVLDLGCGKGAVALCLARERGFQVLGVDLFAPFVEEAQRRAEAEGLAHLCRFEVADLREALRRFSGVDVAVYAAVGNVLGNLETCVALLRGAVHPGGLIVVDHGFLCGTPIERPGYEDYVSHGEALRQLTAFGDSLEAEVLISPEELRRTNRRNTSLISRRVEELSEKRPELTPALEAYLENQRVECETLETRTTEAVWLLKRR